MSSIRCSNCNFINFANEEICRRCKSPLYISLSAKNTDRKDKPPRSFSFVKLVVILAVVGVAYYIYSAYLTPSKGNNANQVPSQPVGLSRTKYDQQRAGNFANNLKDNPSFEAKRQHDEETQKIMNQVSNSSR